MSFLPRKMGNTTGVRNFDLLFSRGQVAWRAGGGSQRRKPHQYVLWSRARTGEESDVIQVRGQILYLEF